MPIYSGGSQNVTVTSKVSKVKHINAKTLGALRTIGLSTLDTIETENNITPIIVKILVIQFVSRQVENRNSTH